MIYMLDTNICIYAINKDHEEIRRKLVEHLDEGICISAITFAELEHGVYKSAKVEKNADNLARFTRIIPVVPFDEHCAAEYGKICAYLQKAGTPIGTMDMLIAAHAKSMGASVITNNMREFKRIPDLKLENWID